MTNQYMTYEECPRHCEQWQSFLKRVKGDGYPIRDIQDKSAVCGCPRTTRTNGLIVYKQPITGNWVVWDVKGWTWLSLSGSWQAAMKTASQYIACRSHRFDDEWHICVPAPTEP